MAASCICESDGTYTFPASGLRNSISGTCSAGSSTMNELTTGSAGSYCELPGWVASITTCPVSPVSVTIFPLIVAGPERIVNSTGNPAVDVAEISNGGALLSLFAICGNEIAWYVGSSVPLKFEVWPFMAKFIKSALRSGAYTSVMSWVIEVLSPPGTPWLNL